MDLVPLKLTMPQWVSQIHEYIGSQYWSLWVEIIKRTGMQWFGDVDCIYGKDCKEKYGINMIKIHTMWLSKN